MSHHAEPTHAATKQTPKSSPQQSPEQSKTNAGGPSGDLQRLVDSSLGPSAGDRASETTGGSLDILTHVSAAEIDLSMLQTLSSDLLHKAQNKSVPSDELLKGAAKIQRPLASATQHLRLALSVAGRELLDRQKAQHKPMKDLIDELGAEPGMRDVIDRVTHEVAMVLSNLDGAADARAELRPLLQGDAGMIVGHLGHLRANVGLKSMGHDELVSLAELKVSVPVLDLGTGLPMEYITLAVTGMALAWNQSVGNFSAAVRTLVDTISHDELKAAHSGLVKKLFEEGKTLLLQAAEIVTGSNLGAKLGFIAIEKLLSYQEKLEQSLVRDDKETFLANLLNVENALRMEGLKDGGNLDVTHAVREIDHEFLQVGQSNPEDAYKRGDQVIIGAQAKFLHDLQARSDAYRANVPSVNEIATRFFVEWINANHKERGNSAWRSPFDGPTHLDGYMALDLHLDFSSVSGFFLHEPSAAHLHCPNSAAVAAQLKRANPDFDLSKLDTNVHVNVVLTEHARKALPTTWDPDWHEWHVHLGPEHVSSDTETTRRKWNWLQQTLHTSTAELLARVTDVKGS